MTTKRRVRCGGCRRSMAQLVPKNRDFKGRSWHYDCLANSVSAALKASIADGVIVKVK
jgi:hypothetical protein